MKRLSICWIIGCLLGLVACRPEVPAQAEQGETDVFPDYREVTVPVNMAPPNFKLVDQQLQGITRLKTMNRELIIAADHGVFNLPETDWKVLSQDAQGKQIDVTVYFREPQSDWKQMCQEIPLTLIWCIAVFFPDIGCGTRWGFINDVLKTMLKSLFLITNRQIIVV